MKLYFYVSILAVNTVLPLESDEFQTIVNNYTK